MNDPPSSGTYVNPAGDFTRDTNYITTRITAAARANRHSRRLHRRLTETSQEFWSRTFDTAPMRSTDEPTRNGGRARGVTSREIDRRQALRLLGAAGVSSVALGACRGSDGAEDSLPAGTSSGSSTTAAPVVGTGPVTADMFKSATACSLTPEQTEGPYYIDVDSDWRRG